MANTTIKDVAKYAGVSTATVSRVINKNYTVSSEINEKVLHAIKELNYYPNSVARSLRKDSTFTIGFLVSDISNSYFTAVAKAVEDVINGKRYNVIVCSTENNKERELEYLRLLSSKKIDGLILNTTGKNDDFIASLSNQIPMVLINRKVHDYKFKGDFIDSDNIQGAYTLTSHLLSLGHRKIAVVNGALDVSTGIERFEGFKNAMASVNINVHENYVYRFDGDFTMESGYQGAAKMVQLVDRPTAVVMMNNAMALGALKYFKLHGVNIPQDISIVSYGDIDNIELMYIQPSIVTLNPRVVGNKAGDLIMQRISSNDIGNRDIVYVPQLIAGNSVKVI